MQEQRYCWQTIIFSTFSSSIIERSSDTTKSPPEIRRLERVEKSSVHVLVVLVEASTKLEKEEILEQLDVSFYHEQSTGPAGWEIQNEDPGPLSKRLYAASTISFE